MLTAKLRERASKKNPAKMPDSVDGQVVKLPQIAARERGPGPARYLLKPLSKHENHDVSKHRNPAFSFGVRLQPNKLFNSPGPCHLPLDGVSRFGVDGSYKYSMLGGANSDKMTKLITPGPGRTHFLTGNLWLPAPPKCKHVIH